MKTKASYLNELAESERLRLLDLLDRAFGDDVYSSNTKSAFFGKYQSKSPNVVLLHVDRDLAGVAVVGTRTINLAGVQMIALTIGPLAIDPHFQMRGLSNILMSGIDDLAVDLGAHVAYLQGTPGFYQRFGYYPLLARTKVSINTAVIQTIGGVQVHPFSGQYLPEMIDLFEVNSRMYSCASKRNEQDWDWLTRHARDSYYFYKPKVVTADDQFVGYFCSDRHEPGRIREAVYETGTEAISRFLSGIKEFVASEGQSSLEIMSPSGSPIHEYLRNGVDAQFKEIIQSNGGQLLKILNPVSLLELMTAGTLLDMPTVKVRDTEDHVFLGTADHSSNGFSNEFSIPKRQLPGLLSGFLSGAPNPRMQSFADTLKCNFLGRLRDQTPFIFQGDNY